MRQKPTAGSNNRTKYPIACRNVAEPARQVHQPRSVNISINPNGDCYRRVRVRVLHSSLRYVCTIDRLGHGTCLHLLYCNAGRKTPFPSAALFGVSWLRTVYLCAPASFCRLLCFVDIFGGCPRCCMRSSSLEVVIITIPNSSPTCRE